ncbi:50S ribosomal protein L32 [Candidatus Kaiserbacteria bacterium]|nr:MAG: 50S ribosomal protein L32 [Candidatus Kaiserbacteria bacterium]
MVIRMRHTRAHTGNRRSHHAIKAETLSKCTHCGASRRPHHMCLECGYYNGRQVIDLAAEKAKRDARIKAKHEQIKNELGSSPEVPTPVAETKEILSKEK